jgi:O-antigen ligase
MWPNVIPLHPHNAALQLWFELGVVGAVLATLFWVWLWARIGAVAEDSRTDAGIAAAVAVAYLTIGALSFGVWQEWWLALGVLGAAVCLVFNQAFKHWTAVEELQELVPLG